MNMLENGDTRFLLCAKEKLSEEMYIISEKILNEVRTFYTGNLKEGKNRKFIENPDNFWAVVVQPRIDELTIVVRGSCEYFDNFSNVEIKKDRKNSYSRFKVTKKSDVDESIKIIKQAKRKL